VEGETACFALVLVADCHPDVFKPERHCRKAEEHGLSSMRLACAPDEEPQ